ncbi:MAG: WhiB family transcriptional regulator [Actinomycetota bacterium]|nr:WhiB family transcriptional regulator [Actinomycetota bacterium]
MSPGEEPRVPLDRAPFPGPWRERGACRVVPTAVFFPARGTSPAAAKEVCRACPVCEDCRAYALPLGDLLGVWGGLAEVERQHLRRGHADPTPAPPVPVPTSKRRRPRRGGVLYRTLEELTAHPGRWARVAIYPGPYTAAGMAGRLRAGTVAAPPGIWQFEGRHSDDGTSGLWAHYGPTHVDVATTRPDNVACLAPPIGSAPMKDEWRHSDGSASRADGVHGPLADV